MNDIVKLINATEEYSPERLLEMSKEAEFRFRNKIPPGFSDADETSKNGAKPGFQKFGDYFIWSDLLKVGSENDKPTLFITNDLTKNDWVVTQGNRKYTPLPDLIREYSLATGGHKFWIVGLEDFLKLLLPGLSEKDENAYLEATRELRETIYSDRILAELSKYSEAHFRDIIYEQLYKIFETYDYGHSYELDYFSIDVAEIEDIELFDIEIDEKSATAGVRLEVTIEATASSHDYWGRDDDTGDPFLSPANELNFDGDLPVSVTLKVEFDESFHLSIKVEFVDEGDIGDICTITTWDEREGYYYDW